MRDCCVSLKIILFVVIIGLIFSIVGCGVRCDNPEAFLHRQQVALPLVSAQADRVVLDVCNGFGCALTTEVVLPETELRTLQSIFSGSVTDATQERGLISNAVAFLEIAVGERAGTANDQARNLRGRAKTGQLDCIAETVNTTVYLLLMQQLNLFAYHTVAPPENRGATVFSAHNTAVIRDSSGQEFAVDSWFHSNGTRPEVVPLMRWRQGFRPAKSESKLPKAARETDMEPEHGV